MKVIIKHPALAYCKENKGSDQIKVQGKMEVCWRCNGTGRHTREDIDDSRLVDNMIEDGDEEGLRCYFRGDYDTVCNVCHGRNVVEVANEKSIPKWASDAMTEWNTEEAKSKAYAESERRMGA